MTVLSSEAVVLRTWPVHEADLIVSFFTRDYGRMRGVAKAALKSRKRFGGALEPMTLARAWFAERPRQELVRLDQLEILRSPLSAPVDHTRMTVLSFYAEVLDEALPEHDPQDAVFRLLASVLEQTSAVESEVVQPWMALTYFSLWMTRLMGLLPDTGRCMVCGEPLALHAAEISYSSSADGFFCGLHATARPARSRPTLGNWRSACCARLRLLLPASLGRANAGRICGASLCKRWSGTWSGGSRARRRWRGWAGNGCIQRPGQHLRPTYRDRSSSHVGNPKSLHS